ncbi:MAG: phytoene/squalene synthase family protein [Proteobacteria bacterium]|nr:phytoene/squalene synthase family protein [Pseudomonadota bacterium]
MTVSESTPDSRLSRGFAMARAVTREHAKTFYFASHLLAPDKRPAAYAVYALCRISDDTVDRNSSSAVREELARVQASIHAAYDGASLTDDVLLAFQDTIHRYAIPREYFDELIEGMRMDLSINSYETFDELYQYCYRVAGVVGLIMLKLFGSSSPAAEARAVDLGVAMQLTNILRDIKEDCERGRIYLPRDELQRFGVSDDGLRDGIVDDKFKTLMSFQISRARDYYRRSAAGISMIADRRSRLVVCAMKDIYGAILRAIEKNRFDVFSIRAHVTTREKLMLLPGILLKGEWVGRPLDYARGR